jgi:SagB-type dehydrogenase family enzyme
LIRGASPALLVAGAAALLLLAPGCAREDDEVRTAAAGAEQTIALPPPQRKGTLSLEEALARRASVRDFSTTPLTEAELGQLLWAAQGISHDGTLRTAPSAGALFPLELYVATAGGVFHYDPARHALERRGRDDVRAALSRAALEQESVRDAPAVFVITAVSRRTAAKYGAARSPRYVYLEAGHAAQNLLLQATALGLGGVPVGAFHDDASRRALDLAVEEEPLYLLPVGHPR